MEQEIYFYCYCISAHLPLSHCTKSLRFAGATLSLWRRYQCRSIKDSLCWKGWQRRR